MIKQQIILMQKRLNEMMDKHVDYKEIYRLSTELDLLIVDFYRKKGA
ncbi:Spo0E family sporulation regulatory protein-aspartic acid phosphatase [Alkaliphilus crotonatoxidans]